MCLGSRSQVRAFAVRRDAPARYFTKHCRISLTSDGDQAVVVGSVVLPRTCESFLLTWSNLELHGTVWYATTSSGPRKCTDRMCTNPELHASAASKGLIRNVQRRTHPAQCRDYQFVAIRGAAQQGHRIHPGISQAPSAFARYVSLPELRSGAGCNI